jgi:glutamate-5-semialdehyde dehydrogenase
MALLQRLEPGQTIIYGGNRTTTVPADVAAAFVEGDRLVVVNDTGDLIHVPAAEWELAAASVERAHEAFLGLGSVSDDAISTFYRVFADRLADDQTFAPVRAANDADVETARSRGRSTTRLRLSDSMRSDMIEGLRMWASTPSSRDRMIEAIEHEGWRVEQRLAGLGVVGFVFEGRPNVFADACGVIRSGNAVVFRIGSDALGTAEAIVEHALDPALSDAGLPPGTATLVASASRAAGHAMFSDSRLALAVARGSGPAVAQLGAVARQAGVPVSLHGTGGAWIIASEQADPERLEAVVANSLDRKVCNTLNTAVVVRSAADRLVPAVLAGLDRAADDRGTNAKLHAVGDAVDAVGPERFDRIVAITRAEGAVDERAAESIGVDQLGHEWEWEESPEITLVLVDSIDEAVDHFNRLSPRFAASLISDDRREQDHFWSAVDAPFVGDGFTRWVDGQYALNRPELGLSNWQFGRLFARGGVLAGDSVFTVRSRVHQSDPQLRR